MAKKTGIPEQAEIFEISDLEQLKVLADPLRVRILETLVKDSRTTKQVAETLGEKPTRLYHHVEALERVGLIRLVKTQQNRGTVEKYYQTVARLFKTDPGLFRLAAEDGDTHPLTAVVNTIMESTTRELHELASSGRDLSDTEDECILSFVEVQGTEEEIAEVRRKLLNPLQEIAEAATDRSDDPAARRYRLTLAYYPIDIK